jgi:hypothetical protein
MIEMTKDEWETKGQKRFGPDKMQWKFICPCCGHIASVAEWQAIGAAVGEVAFSCIGRHMDKPREALGGKGKGPCNYAGGGLFKLNPVSVDGHQVFAFAEVTQAPKSSNEYPD